MYPLFQVRENQLVLFIEEIFKLKIILSFLEIKFW